MIKLMVKAMFLSNFIFFFPSIFEFEKQPAQLLFLWLCSVFGQEEQFRKKRTLRIQPLIQKGCSVISHYKNLGNQNDSSVKSIP
ncbi:hypothetical protein AC625_24865 [Peribacillus loiseleuriae]|uniref:Uncharacterized protein n=1 Tax=Peribacillus loiseleuriae TaxID=1679170 RepID=A0A0K9G519_9BACI|nr:hypothetical protein AC625_24865 [Peribacillus loiseleuriae]